MAHHATGYELQYLDELDGSLFVAGFGADKEEAAKWLMEALLERKLI